MYRGKPSYSRSRGGGLKAGVISAIVIVSALVGIMLAILVMRSIRRRNSSDQVEGDLKDSSFRKAGQNATKDQSEALNIEMDGTGFRDAVISSTRSSGTDHMDYETHLDSDMGTPKAVAASPDPFGAPNMNGGSSRQSSGSSRQSNGHGMML